MVLENGIKWTAITVLVFLANVVEIYLQSIYPCAATP